MATANYGRGRRQRQREAFDGYTFKSIQTGGVRPNVRLGSWLRDNALTQPATLHVPVNVVRHGRSEQFFPVERSGTASESSWGMLGKVWLEIGTQWGLHTHALIAASTALVPTIFMTRVRL